MSNFRNMLQEMDVTKIKLSKDKSIGDIIAKSDILASEKRPDGNFNVTVAFNKPNPNHDKFKMYIIDNKNKIIGSFGTHPSLSGSKKFLKGHLKDDTLDGLTENFKQYLPKVPHDNTGAIDLYNEMVDENNHTGARWMMASYVKDKKLAQAYEAILVLNEYFKDIDDIITARGRLDKALRYVIKQKFSKDELNEFLV